MRCDADAIELASAAATKYRRWRRVKRTAFIQHTQEIPLLQDGGGLGWGLFYPATIESSGSIAPTLTLPRLGGGNG